MATKGKQPIIYQSMKMFSDQDYYPAGIKMHLEPGPLLYYRIMIYVRFRFSGMQGIRIMGSFRSPVVTGLTRKTFLGATQGSGTSLYGRPVQAGRYSRRISCRA